MAKLLCEAEIDQQLAWLRNPSEESKLEKSNCVRITLGTIRLNEYEYHCDRCNSIIEPGQQAILIEYFNGWEPPTEKYDPKIFKPRTTKEEVLLYGTEDY